ncbi:uncharacterized protein [Maniola hyperantus]|uniref:uncharacterized protein isoform X1 n=1 Tax=Aphantopus hyperantus TaxID=2795564 RepID=UPI00156A2E35|nr:mannan-binding lectin serine protease 2-like isoform X1 [Maniola hyperantus]
MKLQLQFIFLAIVVVSTVKSECDTYFKCLGSFFDSFFGNYKKYKTDIKVCNITVPGFDTVNIDSENINDILSGVSDFIQEELDGKVHFGPKLNFFQNVGNRTAIYVKSITINNNFGGNNDHNNSSKNIAPKESIDQLVKYANSSNNLNVSGSVPIKSITAPKEIFVPTNIEKNEIIDDDDPLGLYYDMDDDDNGTDYLKIDYLEIYKDTTNEYTDVKPTELSININKVNDYDKENKSMQPNAIMFENIINNSSFSVADKCSNNTKNVTEAIFPWIAAIFIKNDTSDQFDYYCDGALLSENIVITAARCMEYYGREVNANNLLVLLGKSSLQSMSGTERAVKVKSIIIHENFTKEATSENDIAILLMEGVPLNEHIQTACLAGEKGLEAVTTGWAISGELTIIPFDADQSSNCKVSRIKKICAAYGNDVTICPSYGGVYAVKQRNGWYLQGIRSGDPSDRGLCFDRSVYFTDLSYYVEWIDDNISN